MSTRVMVALGVALLSMPSPPRAETLVSSPSRLPPIPVAQEDDYLSWSEEQAVRIGESLREDGRVGGFFDTRILSTDRSYNYKLRATWLTPEAIRASARLTQLREFLTDEETRALVAEAESVADTVFLVEIDPREGSGVIPLDWIVVLRPKSDEAGSTSWVRGESKPALRQVKALSGVAERDYSYDVFWVIFTLTTESGQPLFDEDTHEAELVVRIYEKEGRVSWPIPASIRERMQEPGGAHFPW